jgi:NAD dependent epimerase/dehydratase family enzyme
VTNGEFTRALAGAVHRPAVLPAPAFALRIALGQMADEALLSSARVYPARLVNAGFQFTYPTVGQALAASLESPG